MEEAQRPGSDSVTQAAPSDLVATLRRCCDALAAIAHRDDVPSSRLQQVGRGLVTASAFLQTAEQAQISALGVDFVAAARWLSGYYEAVARDIAKVDQPRLIIGSVGTSSLERPPTPLQLSNVSEALVATAAMWREVADAAEAPSSWHGGSCATQDSVAAEHTAPEQPTYHGVVRIWTAVAAALATSVTSGQLRGERQVIVATQLMVATAREAAVMAEAMGREE